MKRIARKDKILNAFLLDTTENQSFTNLHTDDSWADCSDAAWQQHIRIRRNNPNGKLAQAKQKHQEQLKRLNSN
jgi:hypothetical protein